MESRSSEREPAERLQDDLYSRVESYWAHYNIAIEREVQRLYNAHRTTQDDASVFQAFLEIPEEAPIHLVDFQLTPEDLFGQELLKLEARVLALKSVGLSIADGYRLQLEIAQMCPFFLAVLIKFLELTGVAAVPFTFFYTTGGWLAHKDLHAQLDLARPDHRARPRIPTFLCADSNSGKTPWYELFVKNLFL